MKQSAFQRFVPMFGLLALISAPMVMAQDMPNLSVDGEVAADGESIDDALDRAIVDLRIAEKREEGWTEAFERAKAAVSYALERDPENLRGRFYRARMLIMADREREARSAIEAWTNSRDGANDWEGFVILAQQYAKGQFYKLAKPKYRKALELNPRDARIYFGLAQCALNLVQRAEAVQWAREGVKAMGADVTSEAYRLLGQALFANSQFNDAQRSAEYAVELDKAEIRASGADVDRLQSLDTSLAQLLAVKQAMLQENPTRTELYLDIAKLMQSRADVSYRVTANQALAIAFSGLSQANPRPTEEHVLHVAKLLIRLDRPDDAVKLLDRMLTELYPSSQEGKMLMERLQPAKLDATSDGDGNE